MKLLITLLIAVAAVADPSHVVNDEFLKGYNKFTSNIYKEVAQSFPQNFLISPISADLMLALAEYGSAGETSKQLVKGLSLPENKEKIREAVSALTPKLNTNDKYTLSSANKIYVKDGISLLEDFKKFGETVYNAGIENINFNANDEAAKKMNGWVEDQTHGKIKDLVDKDELGPDTRTVFINAMYFRGTWKTKFNPTDTAKGSFRQNEESKIDVNFMETTSKFRFHNDHVLEAKFLELPYNGEDVTLTIVLPNDPDGLQKLESKMEDVFSHARYILVRVHVKIPKFEIDTKIEFNEYLKKLGIVNAFNELAEFPKITGEQLTINKVVQKAHIEVDEEGTRAAVATAVDEVSRSAHVLHIIEEFIADHPFVFFLKYKDVILFTGHYTGKQG